ncbi:MAG: hypothetical protein OEX12_08000, partial [Gammaproteobacteria bacterium]|nr:hypothetical protein [Gammaproteobacteria bacterium]
MIKQSRNYEYFCDVGHNLILVMSVSLLLMACTNVLLQPMEAMIRTPTDIGIEYEDVTYSSQDGMQLHGWYLPTNK